MANLEKLNSFTEGKTSGWREKAKWRAENKEWLKQSAMIAVRVLLEIKAQSISQKILAERMGVSPQQINKVVKGQENLKLETICKLEKALKVSLISILSMEETQAYPVTQSVKVSSERLTSFVKSPKMELLGQVESFPYRVLKVA